MRHAATAAARPYAIQDATGRVLCLQRNGRGKRAGIVLFTAWMLCRVGKQPSTSEGARYVHRAPLPLGSRRDFWFYALFDPWGSRHEGCLFGLFDQFGTPRRVGRPRVRATVASTEARRRAEFSGLGAENPRKDSNVLQNLPGRFTPAPSFLPESVRWVAHSPIPA